MTDLGTEFGVAVGKDGACEVHVLKGAVNADFVGADGRTSPGVRVKEGEARRFERGTGRAAMIPVRRAEFESMRIVSADGRRERWLAYSEQLRNDPALVAYYTFQPLAGGSPSVLPNLTAAGAALDGRIAGAEWVHGRWPGKFGLYFHGPGSEDKVVLPEQERFNFTGPFSVAVWFEAERFTGAGQAWLRKGTVPGGSNRWAQRNSLRLTLPEWARGRRHHSTQHPAKPASPTTAGTWPWRCTSLRGPGRKNACTWTAVRMRKAERQSR